MTNPYYTPASPKKVTLEATPQEPQAPTPAVDGPICLRCLHGFIPRTTWQKFCSSRCRNEYHSAKRGWNPPSLDNILDATEAHEDPLKRLLRLRPPGYTPTQ